MLNRLILWSLDNRLLVVLGAVLLLAVGTWTALRLPVDVFPDLTAPTVTVLAEAHGMAPEEIEKGVAVLGRLIREQGSGSDSIARKSGEAVPIL